MTSVSFVTIIELSLWDLMSTVVTMTSSVKYLALFLVFGVSRIQTSAKRWLSWQKFILVFLFPPRNARIVLI